MVKFPCAICLRSIPDHPWGVTECGHVFHEECCIQALGVTPREGTRRVPGVGPCPKCRVMTRFIRVYCPDVKEMLDEVSRLCVTQLAHTMSGLDITNQVIVPSLPTLPKQILRRIFHFLIDGTVGLATLQTLDTTCRLFHVVIGEPSLDSDEFQYKTSLRDRVLIPKAIANIKKSHRNYKDTNTLIRFFGGAYGVRKILHSIFQKMKANHVSYFEDVEIDLRGDTIECLSQIVQGNIIMRLKKANDVAIHRSKPADAHPYPEISVEDLKFVDTMFGTYMGMKGPPWSFVSEVPCDKAKSLKHGMCTHLLYLDLPEYIAEDVSWQLARALAVQAGVVKLGKELPTFIATEILHCMAFLCVNAFGASHIYSDPSDYNARYISRSEGEHCFEQGTNYFSEYSPPYHHNEEGKVMCTIIPRQIKDSGMRLGMQPILGFGLFGAEWASINKRSKTREISEAREQYYPTMNAEDGDSDYVSKSDELNESSHCLDIDFDDFSSASSKCSSIENMEEEDRSSR